jgi:hypothetical protein
LKRIVAYTALIAALAGLLHGCTAKLPASDKRIPDLRENYRHDNTLPFGGYTAHRLISAMYPSRPVSLVKENIEDTRRNSYDTGALYISVSKSLYTSEEDVTAIKNYVRAGNNMLLAANEFDKNLLDELGFGTFTNTRLQALLNVEKEQTVVRLEPSRFGEGMEYGYFFRPFENYFSGLSSSESAVLGRNKAGKPNFVVFFIGSGRLFLHCEPRAFSNYFLLQKSNYRYLQQVLAYCKPMPEKVIWNNYYNSIGGPRSKGKSGSMFDGLKGGLLWAFWLALGLMALYLLNGSKRRQRIIPVQKPNENTTVAFAETVGLLYLQKKDNKNIAEKMITYFNEFVRNQYFLNTHQANSDFVTTLSRKSGVPHDKVESLYRTIAHTQQSNDIDDYQLLSLNQQIQNFYKYRN